MCVYLLASSFTPILALVLLHSRGSELKERRDMSNSTVVQKGQGHLALHKETGKVVDVESVPNGLKCGCICAGCGGEMVAKNNGKKKAHHFAHYVATTSCGGEGALHKTAKIALRDRLATALADGSDVPLQWFCDGDTMIHDGDLIKLVEADDVWMEEAIVGEGIKPDLTLARDGEVKAVIEIVVTHAPEPRTEDYARKAEIPLVVLKVVDWRSVDILMNGTMQTDAPLNYCPHHKPHNGAWLAREEPFNPVARSRPLRTWAGGLWQVVR